MPTDGAFIDANLLVLLVVGSVDRRLVETHRRTRQFTVQDYDRLFRIVDVVPRVFVTPNTLTEASNLLENPHDIRFLNALRILIEGSEEICVASVTATRNSAFVRLGLSDAVLLEAVSAERPLITVDLTLFSAAFEKGEEAAINFTYYQNL
jgi:hypothetical protein